MVRPVIYTFNLSPPCRAVDLCANALGIDLERKVINLLTGDQLKPEFLKINPQHTIPVLDDNGVIIRDSHAIMIYLVNKYGKNDHLYPRDPIKQAKVNAALHFNSGVLFARLRFVSESIFYRKNPVIPEDKLENVLKAYRLLEDGFEEDYVAGSSLTIADFACVSSLSIVGVIPLDPVQHPKVHRWLSRLQALPYYEEANGSGADQLSALLVDMLAKNAKAASDQL